MDRIRFGAALVTGAAVVATTAHLWQSSRKHSPTSKVSKGAQKHSTESPPESSSEKEQVGGLDGGTNNILMLPQNRARQPLETLYPADDADGEVEAEYVVESFVQNVDLTDAASLPSMA